MNKWQKAGLAAGLAGVTLSAMHMINKRIFSSSISRGVTNDSRRAFFQWKLGNIAYTKTGSGSPLLLVHDLMPCSSSYEWKHISASLAKNHTVYSIDLLGCGHSDKPNITYTTYLYVQMLSDFIKKVIGRRTDVIASGNSIPMVVMTCYSDNTLFNKLILINPPGPGSAARIPLKNMNLMRSVLNAPVLGTCIYNICMRKKKIEQDFSEEFFSYRKQASRDILNAYHESAHLAGSGAKYLYTSILCRYTDVSIARALSEINNSIFIIGGGMVNRISTIIRSYVDVNPAVEFCVMENTGKLPQLENPKALLKHLKIYL